MPVRFSDIANLTRSFSIKVGDETLNVTYRIGEMTPTRSDGLATAMRDSKVTATEYYALTLDVIESWDLLGDDGEPLTVDEAAAGLPASVLQFLRLKIEEDAAANPPIGKSSAT